MKTRVPIFIISILLLLILSACGSSTNTPPANPSIETPEALSSSKQSTSFSIYNTSSQTLEWSLGVENAAGNAQAGDWFTVSPASGTLVSDEQVVITLTLLDGLLPGMYTSTLTVVYTGGSQSFTVSGVIEGDTGETKGSFTLSTDNVNNSVVPGGQVQVPIFINRESFTDPVTLELLGAPEGITGSVSPAQTSGDSATLTLSTDGSVASGSYTVSVRGTSGTQSASTDVTLFVVGDDGAEESFSLALSSASINASAGESKTIRVTVNSSDGFDSAVSLKVTSASLPDGVSASFAPASTKSTSDLTLTLASSVKAGAYNLVIRGQGGGLTRNVTLGLNVSARDSESGAITGVIKTDNSLIPLISSTSIQNETAGVWSGVQADAPAYVAGQLLVAYNEDAVDAVSLTDPLIRNAAQTLGYSALLQTQTTGATPELTRTQKRTLLAASVQQQYKLSSLTSAPVGQADLVALNDTADTLAVAQMLTNDTRVKYASPNYYLYATGIPNDTNVKEQWALTATGVPVAWSVETGTKNDVVVAVIDTGFDLNHKDLSARFAPGYDFCAVSSGSCNNQKDDDPGNAVTLNNHGTHVAGLIGAIGNNSRGVAGVAYGNGVTLVPVKVFDDNGSGATLDAFINGIRWAAGLSVTGAPDNPNPADVINLSLGGYFEINDVVQDAIDDARNAGAIIIAAAGNNGLSQIMSPAGANNVIAVGAVNDAFERACFSNYGNSSYGPGKLDIVAPGGEGAATPSSVGANPGCNPGFQGLLSTTPNNTYTDFAGTSMASPMVAGVAALLLSNNPTLSVPELESLLLASTYFDNTYMSAAEYGAGVLRADVAFGFAGPGDSVSVTAEGVNVEDSYIDTVVLDLYGQSEPYALTGLQAGTYQLTAVAAGATRDLSVTKQVKISEGETREGITLTLQR